MKFPKLIPVLAILLLSACGRVPAGKVTLNYIEYNRGLSSPTHSDLGIRSGDSDLAWHGLSLEDRSFFPDDSIFPNAFFSPLVHLRLEDALKAFTEPYYGIRLFHFFKSNPHIGVGIDFIHFKVFLRRADQPVRVTGTEHGQPVDRETLPADGIDFLSVSHGVNHVALSINYRWLLAPTQRIPEGRWQPFVSLGVGPAVPHLELWTKENGLSRKRADNYQLGFPNFGFNAGAGMRLKLSPHFGLFAECKLTYSWLHGMYCEDESGSRVRMAFLATHVQWGFSYIF